MPCVPIEIPSETVMVLKRTPFPPEISTDFSTISESAFMCILHGVTFAPVEAIPTNGFVKSSDVKPTPLSIDLDAA